MKISIHIDAEVNNLEDLGKLQFDVMSKLTEYGKEAEISPNMFAAVCILPYLELLCNYLKKHHNISDDELKAKFKEEMAYNISSYLNSAGLIKIENEERRTEELTKEADIFITELNDIIKKNKRTKNWL